jgi:thiol-disulfide isomerase/thioredoxin
MNALNRSIRIVRPRGLLLALLGVVALGAGCNRGEADGPGARKAAPIQTGQRAAAVKPKKKAGGKKAAAGFCEQSFAAGERPWKAPPERDLPAPQPKHAEPPAGAWTWVNLWATWCTPCIDEMGLLGRWKEALNKEGAPIELELLSIDDEKDGPALAKWLDKGLPGPVSWLKGQDDFGPLLDTLGVDRNAAIPIHALVDPKGDLRCVRVGAIHGHDYAAVKALVSGG